MPRRRISFSLLILLLHVFSYGQTAHIRAQNVKKPTCGYESCPKVDPKKLNIHIVPHTHDDVGWLKTVDQYYYGSQSRYQKAGVQYIIDTVIEALRDHPERRFVYVETAYFWKWWQKQSDKIQDEVRSFINDGRLEIIGGGWSMNDEAVTHYQSMIDQYTWGFRRLNDTLGECARPRVGWQIDPFGHSREQASMFAQMGFDGMLFGRLDYQDKSKRLTNKTAEFIWKASSSLGNANLFSVALFNTYSPPPGFCFDILCNDEPMIDDDDSPENNIDARVKSFIEYTRTQAQFYRANHILLTMGGDFTYQQAQMSFKNLDKLIRYTNEKYFSYVNVFYSTPSCYLKSLNNLNLGWPTKYDDFFPYASDPHAYWTGYYTSRPTLKFYERMGNNFLQIVKQLSVLSNLDLKNDHLDQFREAMGVMQHHDAVTGTEKQHVAADYARILHESMSRGADIVSQALGEWSVDNMDPKPRILPDFHTCPLLNISACQPSEENDPFLVTIYNPLSQSAMPYIRIPVRGEAYSVKNHAGIELTTQLVPIPPPVLKTPGRVSNAKNELVFRVDEIGPLSYRSFYVSEIPTVVETNSANKPANISSIGGELYDITINAMGNIEVQWKNKRGMKLEQSFHYYEGAEGNNEIAENRSSGAYIFRPRSPTPRNVKYVIWKSFYKGPLVEEIHVSVNDWISEVVRVYNDEERIEFHWAVGPIPIDDDKIGKEIITRYSSNLVSGGVFYTDSNGREMLERKKNYRPTWNLELAEPIAGNYYPIASKISLKDEDKKLRLSVLVDRSQGGSSLRDGELELMIHRRLLKDDAFGVGEALNETVFGTGLVARGQHYVFGSDLNDLDASALKEKSAALELALRPWTLISPADRMTFEEWKRTYSMQKDGLKQRLPPNVRILTLEPWKKNTVLLRLEHIFEINEAATLSSPAVINIQDLFDPFTIISARETTLGGNHWIENNKKFRWHAESNEVDRPDPFEDFIAPISPVASVVNVVLLKPMEIRTFVIEVARKRKTILFD